MIRDDEDILIQTAIDSACYKMVDLGLSVKWANKNVGASYPEDPGLYFQWGDAIGYTADQVGKDKAFNRENYKFGTYSNLTKYNSTDGLTVLESIDDAATAYMGPSYRMPTIVEVEELIENTIRTFIDIDGNEYIKGFNTINIESGKLKGVRFTGLNGNSIFIPAAGYCDESRLYEIVNYGELWSSSLDSCYNDSAKGLGFYYGGVADSSYNGRFYGLSVRGVQDNLNKS